MPHATKTQWSDHWKSVVQGKLNQGLGSAGPGGSIYALENNSEIMSHNFGKASVANNVNFTVDTPCGIRSVTKTITTSLAMLAEGYSQLGWFAPQYNGGVIDKDIGDFLVISQNIHRETDKYLNLSSRPPEVHTNCTLRHLAAHQARIVSIWGLYSGIVDREILKKLMESIGNIDDLVAQTGAVQGGMSPSRFAEVTDPAHPDFGKEAWSDWGLQDYRRTYNDKAHWITGAILEELFGQTLYQLMESMFNGLGLTTAYPSYDGNLIGSRNGTISFKGHFANPIEIPGLAVAYNNYRGPNGDTMYLEPEQSTESGYAIGSAVMSSKDLAKWAHALRSGSIWGIPQDKVDMMFSVQTGSDSPSISNPDLVGDYIFPNPTGSTGWPGVNWGFGPQKLESVQAGSGATVEVWGNVGQGGFGGYGGCVVWVNHNGTSLVVTANTNTGIAVNDAYHAAKDYIESFL